MPKNDDAEYTECDAEELQVPIAGMFEELAEETRTRPWDPGEMTHAEMTMAYAACGQVLMLERIAEALEQANGSHPEMEAPSLELSRTAGIVATVLSSQTLHANSGPVFIMELALDVACAVADYQGDETLDGRTPDNLAKYTVGNLLDMGREEAEARLTQGGGRIMSLDDLFHFTSLNDAWLNS